MSYAVVCVSIIPQVTADIKGNPEIWSTLSVSGTGSSNINVHKAK
jgi:hypothetical protein